MIDHGTYSYIFKVEHKNYDFFERDVFISLYLYYKHNCVPWCVTYVCISYGWFLKWWYPQNTPKWSFLVGKPMVVGYHHFRKAPYIVILLFVFSYMYYINPSPGWFSKVVLHRNHHCGVSSQAILSSHRTHGSWWWAGGLMFMRSLQKELFVSGVD